jgi:hypothetical protein
LTNQADLLRVNPEIKAYLAKQLHWEDKKLHETKKARIILNEETRRETERTANRALKHFRKLTRSIWQQEPRVLDAKVML